MEPLGPGADEVRRAAAAARAALEPHADADWQVAAGDLDWSARRTLVHVLGALLWYARDLATAATGTSDDDLDFDVEPDATPRALVRALGEMAAVVAAVVAGTPPDVRGWHPYGRADGTGFAAMACDEILIHTDDVCRGLGVPFDPPRDLCAAVLARLFPWAPAEGDAWERLRWCNGRAALGDRPRLEPGWRWHAAPLEEWDGTAPAGVS